MFIRNGSWQALTVAAALSLATLHAQPAPPAPPKTPKIWTLSSHSYLGVNVRELDAARAKELKLKDEAGVEVTNVDEDGPAAKAGIKATDVVLEYNNQRVEGTEQFIRLVRETPAGRAVHLKISRNGGQQTLSAVIGQRKENMAIGAVSEAMRQRMEEVRRNAESLGMEHPRGLQIGMPDVPRAKMAWRSGMLGIEAEALEPQLAEYFGVERGVLVRAVSKDTPAMKAGLKAGDVIVKVEDAKVARPQEITSAIRAAKDKRPISLRVLRQKTEMGIEVQVEIESAVAPKARTLQKLDREIE